MIDPKRRANGFPFPLRNPFAFPDVYTTDVHNQQRGEIGGAGGVPVDESEGGRWDGVGALR